MFQQILKLRRNVLNHAFNEILKATMSLMFADHTKASGTSLVMSPTYNSSLSVDVTGIKHAQLK